MSKEQINELFAMDSFLVATILKVDNSVSSLRFYNKHLLIYNFKEHTLVIHDVYVLKIKPHAEIEWEYFEIISNLDLQSYELGL